MLSRLSKTQKGILFAISGFVSFSLADACAKWLSQYYEVFDILFWTYSIAFIISLAASPFLGGLKATLNTKKLPFHLGRGACTLVIGVLVVNAFKTIPIATVYTILFTAPFLISIISIPIYKEKVSPKNWGIIALGFSGILIAFRPGIEGISMEILYSIGALCAIIGLSMLARPLENDTLHSLSFYPTLCTSVVLGLILFNDLSFPAVEHLPIFTFNALCVSIGLTGIAAGFRIAPYSKIAPIHYIQMVIAITLGYFVFDDVPNFWMLIGAAIIVVSGVLFALNKDNKA